ncbi:MAG: hypothetical protein WBX22_09875 [Silvibacterium sp.]
MPTFESKRRGTGSDPYTRQFRKGTDQFVSEAVSKILVLGVPADVDERQDGYGRHPRARWSRGTICHYAGYKLISSAGNRRDVATLAPTVLQNTSKNRDVLVEIILFDGRVRPHRLHEFFFREHSPEVLYKVYQRVVSLCSHSNRRTVAP